MNGSVAQLNRALDYGSSGSRFESLRNHSDSWEIKEIGFGAFCGCNLKECYKEKIVSCFGYDCLSDLIESIPSNVRKIFEYL